MTFIKKNNYFNALLIALIFQASSSIAAEQNQKPPATPVEVDVVKQSDVAPNAIVMGTIHSQNQLQLTAGVTGKLEWVVSPGSSVRQGDLIAQIELLPLQLQQAERKAQFKRAKINLSYLKKELQRQQQLRTNKNTSQLQLEQTESQVEIAKSDLEIARLQLEQAEQQLERATVVAPFDGIVTQRLRRSGFDVGRSDVLVHLLDIRNLEARAFVPAKYLTNTEIGAKVILSSKTSNNKVIELEATTSSIIPSVDPLSQTFEMRINLPVNATKFWSAGELIQVKIPLTQTLSTLSVRRDSLILRSDGVYVVKIDKENKAHRIKVTVGKGQKEWVEVKGDIEQGDKVAIRGAERLREGQSVEILNATAINALKVKSAP